MMDVLTILAAIFLPIVVAFVVVMASFYRPNKEREEHQHQCSNPDCKGYNIEL